MSKWHLSEHITEHMTRPRMGDPRVPNLWPSEASAVLVNSYGEDEHIGACRRAVYLRYTSDMYQYSPDEYTVYQPLVEEVKALTVKPDRYMQWIWAAGNLFENFVIEQAKQSGVYLADQVQVVVPEAGVVGKLDLMVVNPETGGIIAEEIKSIYGHNATSILGTPGMQNKQQVGKPRSSNLMQIAIYDWHLRKRIKELEVSRLFYGARDTGRFGEFNIKTELNTETGVTDIKYQAIVPNRGAVVTSPISIENILSQYKYIKTFFAEQILPRRDYDMNFTDEKIQLMYDRGELGKTDTESHRKILERVEENKERIAEGKKPKAELKPLRKGDWNCSFCSFKNFCYSPEGAPRFG
jgi:hypothetical protein